MSNIVIPPQQNQTSAIRATNRSRQFLTFLVGQDVFGVDILDVKEILAISTITQIPLTPDYIRGVINLRGSVAPIIDLAARLQRQTSNIGKHSCIILVAVETPNAQDAGNGKQILGLLVDQVNEIMELATENILPAPDFGAEISTEFIQGMGRVENMFVILLALNRILSIAELSKLHNTVKLHTASEYVQTE